MGSSHPSKINLAIMALLVLLGAAQFWPALGMGYVADDFGFLIQSDAATIWAMDTGIYRPMGHALMICVDKLAGPSAPLVAHTLQLLAHVASAYLLYLLARRLLSHPIAAAIPAFLWLMSPTAVQPVYWVCAGAFYIPVSILLWVALLVETRDLAEGSAWLPAKAQPLVLGLCYAGALLFHEIGLVLLPICVLWYLSSQGVLARLEKWRAMVWRYLPMGLVLAGYAAIRLTNQMRSALITATPQERVGVLLLSTFKSILYTDHLIWRVVHWVWSLSLGGAAAVVAIFVAALIAAWMLIKHTGLRFSLAAMVVALVPPVMGSMGQNRYLYVSAGMGALAIGCAADMALSWACRRSPRWLEPSLAIASCLVCVAMMVIHRQGIQEGGARWLDMNYRIERVREETFAQLEPECLLARAGETALVDLTVVDFPRFYPSKGIRYDVQRADGCPLQIGKLDAYQMYTDTNVARETGDWDIVTIQPSAIPELATHSIVLLCHPDTLAVERLTDQP